MYGCVYERGELTSRSLHDALRVGFVSSRYLADGFVASGHEDDGEEREDERGHAGDVPGGEDDAEIGRVPGEQHLFERHVSVSSDTRT